MTGLIRRCCGLVLALIILGGARTALACACCTDEGQRNVGTVELDSGKRQEIESLRFGGKATLFTGAGDVEGVEGITTPSGSYDLTAKWLDNRLVFSFRDKGGHSGTLAMARPNTVSVFTSVTRVMMAWKSSLVVTTVPAPVKLPHCASVAMLVESQVFGPQLGMGSE